MNVLIMFLIEEMNSKPSKILRAPKIIKFDEFYSYNFFQNITRISITFKEKKHNP